MIPTVKFVRFGPWWAVNSSEGRPLGTIVWHMEWGRYVYNAFNGTLDTTQMAVIVDFITNAMNDLDTVSSHSGHYAP